mmetsp:Transcript_14277/g.29149  ORF Transcript_14277/g.29149 Transcript_14277/m.29149 type:complete len:89 (-) Transcript_14277:777-1043(-)
MESFKSGTSVKLIAMMEFAAWCQSNIKNDLSQWNEHEIINLSDDTWMDDTGEAEVTAGVKPDSIRVVDIYTFISRLSPKWYAGLCSLG